MMQHKLSIKKASLIWFPILLCIMYPYSLNTVLPYWAKYILYGLMLGISLVAIGMYLLNIRMDIYIFFVIVYCGIMIHSTLVNGGNVTYVLLIAPDFPIVKIIGMCALVTMLLKMGPKRCCDILLPYFMVIVSLNFLSIILFPGGMYKTGQDENYLLGFDNTHCVIYYFALTIAFIRDRVNSSGDNMKLSFETKMLLVIVNLSVVICMSGTSVIQLFFFDLLFIFKDKIKNLKVFNFKVAILINVFFSLFLIFIFTKQGNTFIAYIAERFLHKDATFTARVFLWQRVQNLFVLKPWIGYGWGIEEAISRFNAYHAHNQYLTELYYGGIPMLIALFMIVFAIAIKLDKYREDCVYPYLLIVFFTSIFHWNAESLHIPMQLVTFAMIYNVDKICENRNNINSRRY